MGDCFKIFSSQHCVIILTVIILVGGRSKATPAAAGITKLFQHGTKQTYHLVNTVTLNEQSDQKGKDVGYRIEGDVIVGIIWQNDQDKNEKLLEFELKEPKLLVKSRKASESASSEGFDVHKSELEKYKNFPYLAHWKNGQIINIYTDEREEISIINLKKGITSSFQFQILDFDTVETDASGNCQVAYKSIDPFSFSKTKTNCLPLIKFPSKKHFDPILRPNVTSSIISNYKLSQDLAYIESISTHEFHELNMIIKKEVRSCVTANQSLFLKDKKGKSDILQSLNLDEAVKEFEQIRKLKISKSGLHLQQSSSGCDKEDCPSLPKLFKENENHLLPSNLGTHKSATAFVKLLSAARSASKDDIAKILKKSKNKEIFLQLCDLAGAIQLPKSHEVIMSILNFESEGDFEKIERYLWALSSGSYPQEAIIKDIFKITKKPHSNEKLSETLVLTLASMAHKLSKITEKEENVLLKEITKFITGELELCKEEDCKAKYLRALKNLKCPRTIPILIQHALTGKKKASVEAMKALKSFEPSYWGENVIDAAQRIYFEAGRKYDSSSRTLAMDILLESNPRREVLQELLLTLVERNPSCEVTQYLAQRVKQLLGKNQNFSKVTNAIFKEFKKLFNNYNIQARKGLTSTFDRYFSINDHRNGSLSTFLEISKGLLKRGTVDIVIETPEQSTSLFTLGLFMSRSFSIMSSDEDDDESENEPFTAGMELSVLGSQLRPFVFFTGQGELMGHVWSGTASEKTPAYQALVLVIDHLEKIPLQSGFLVQIEVFGGVSFDLSGQIQISLWNKNAHSLVEKNAGISLQGKVSVDSSFVKSKMEFNVASEVKLNLQSDLNFYSEALLCMQLTQPEVLITHNIHKIESIPGEKYRVRKSKSIQEKVLGRSYALNKKNNEMCNLILN